MFHSSSRYPRHRHYIFLRAQLLCIIRQGEAEHDSLNQFASRIHVPETKYGCATTKREYDVTIIRGQYSANLLVRIES